MFKCTVYDKKRHILQRPELIEWCKRQQGVSAELAKSLFCYWHSETNNFIIARWITRGLMAEMFCVGPSLALFDRRMAGEFLDMIRRPATPREVKQHLETVAGAARDAKDNQSAMIRESNERRYRMSA